MRVILKDNWFVEGRRIRRSPNKQTAIDIPDRLRDRLPKSAKIVDDDYVAPGPDAGAAPTALSQMGKGPKRSMVDFLGSNPEGVEPEPGSEPTHPEDDVDELIAKAKAVAKPKRAKK